MTTEEGTTVELSNKIELSTNGAAVKTEEENFKTTESPALLTVNLEAESVKDSEVAVESNSSSVKLDSTTPVDVQVTVVKEIKEEIKGGESKVVANGHSGSKREENGEDVALSSESDGVTILPHWHAKPCVHITGLGGVVTEEDLVPLLTPHGRIVSIVFENDRRDSTIVRYEPSGAEAEDIVARVREAINNKEIKDKTLVVEPFRPDSLLFIGNLTPEIDDGVLRQMFEPHGTVERAFVLRNAGGRSKGYGFVEYSLKSQASASKVAMGNINMDGRVLRVEWSDCRKISDMFSTVLFVDRISKDSHHIEQTLRNIFGQFGRVRDCHLAIGMNQQLRGFAFIDYYHSTFADKAHEALDGRDVEGSNIRVSFANPSKSAQSYKSRFGTQTVVPVVSNPGRGTFPDHMIRPGGPVLGAAMRSHTAMPVLGNRFIGHGRSSMLGMSIGMQFGRGAPVGPGMIGRNLVPPLIASGAGMLGPGSVAAGMMGRVPGLMLGHNGQRGVVAGGFVQQGSRLPSGRGPVPISSAAIAQVATAQAKAREEEAKARAEAQAKQSQAGAKQSAAEQERLEQFRKMAAQQAQLLPQHHYYQQHSQSSGLDQQYKQGSSKHSYQPHQQSAQQQSAPHTLYQHQPASQQAPASEQSQYSQQSQQSQQSYNSQYYPQSTQQSQQQQQQQQQQSQSLPQPSPQLQQQQSAEQYSQQQAYYQQPAQPSAQAGVTPQQQYAQYSQQYGQQYAQQYGQQQQPQQQQQVQLYGQQPTTQQYTEASQLQAPVQYTQQDYANYYAQQQQPQTQLMQTPTVAVAAITTGATPIQTVDASQQQQAYAAYYQQRAQDAVAQAGTTPAQTTTSTASSTASLEAQWAAYYAAQAAHQQATATTTTTTTTTTTAYDQQQANYAQHQPYSGIAAYYQQSASVDVGQKRAADQIDYSNQTQAGYRYLQHPSTVTAGYTEQQAVNGTIAYQQQPATAASAYQQPATALTSYEQPAVGYQQQSPSAIPAYTQLTPATSGYTQAAAGGYQQVAAPSPSGYQQSGTSVVAGYQQPSAATVSVYSQPNQTAVPVPIYDYSKRPRF